MTYANPADSSLYPELDAAALAAFVAALETGDVTGLSPARASEVAEVRSLAVFGRGKVVGVAAPCSTPHCGGTPDHSPAR